MSSPRFATVSRRFKFGIVYQFPLKTTTDKQFPRSTCCVRVFCDNISHLRRGMTPTSHRAALNKTLLERKRFQTRFLVFQAKTRGRRTSQGIVDTATVHHQSSRFANPAVQTKLLSSTCVCRQLHHRRLLLLEFLLQMTILPPVSDDSNAKISETCLILCLATTRSLQ